MINTCYHDMEALLPHKNPMVFVDSILGYDIVKRTIITAFTITEKSIFYCSMSGGVPVWVGIEYMAQSLGVLSGIYAQEHGKAATELAFLLGTRSYVMHANTFELDETYTVHASEIFTDSELGSYSCSIQKNDFVYATADLNTFTPHDPSIIINQRNHT